MQHTTTNMMPPKLMSWITHGHLEIPFKEDWSEQQYGLPIYILPTRSDISPFQQTR